MRADTAGVATQRVAALLAVALTTTALALPNIPSSVQAGEMITVIVREARAAGTIPEAAVAALGGRVLDHIRLINSFVAEVPAGTVARLRRSPGVDWVTRDRRVHLAGHDGAYDPAGDAGSIYDTTRAVKARGLWNDGITGRGIDVALIDSGVVPVDGLSDSSKIVNGPDLSWESQAGNLRYLDTFGHGTHMAGLIAGRESAAVQPYEANTHNFIGVAPDARVLNIKVADSHGAADVSQVIAAIDWVVQHRNDPGLNVRVLNLSFGTDGTQSYRIDPLAHAAEVAWRKGIVVVVAAGNTGFGNAELNNPAYDPYVIAVGADDTKGTPRTDDDVVPGWSAPGVPDRPVDLVAPGKSVVSLRSPGSHIDVSNPAGRVSTRYFRGSGTSMAAAVVSGGAALLLQHRPSLTPDQVKSLLVSTATGLAAAGAAQGAGLINLNAARRATPSLVPQSHPRSTGLGSLELARGTAHLEAGGVELRGEVDIHGMPWLGTTWALDITTGDTWIDGFWNGAQWSGNTWSGTSPMGTSWGTVVWSGNQWSGNQWSGNQWSGNQWSGNQWSGNQWSSGSWGA